MEIGFVFIQMCWHSSILAPHRWRGELPSRTGKNNNGQRAARTHVQRNRSASLCLLWSSHHHPSRVDLLPPKTHGRAHQSRSSPPSSREKKSPPLSLLSPHNRAVPPFHRTWISASPARHCDRRSRDDDGAPAEAVAAASRPRHGGRRLRRSVRGRRRSAIPVRPSLLQIPCCYSFVSAQRQLVSCRGDYHVRPAIARCTRTACDWPQYSTVL
jgi:hypothetical protein